MSELILRFSWKVTNTRTNAMCIYSSSVGYPVTSDHVRRSPSVIAWAGGDYIHVSEVEWLRDDVKVRKTNE